MVKLLVQHGAQVDARSRVNQWERQVSAEPRMQVNDSPRTQMVFGMDVEAMTPGQPVTLDASASVTAPRMDILLGCSTHTAVH